MTGHTTFRRKFKCWLIGNGIDSNDKFGATASISSLGLCLQIVCSISQCFRRCEGEVTQTIRYSLADSNTINFNNDRGIGSSATYKLRFGKISYTIIFATAVTLGRKR
nr:hypothetical protein SAML2017_37770 [Salmonella enterica]